MNNISPLFTLEDMYGKLALSDEEFEAKVTRSLQPRGPEMLYEVMAALGIEAAHYVLDIGCCDASYACELARRFQCQLLAVDPVSHHIEQAQVKILETGQSSHVTATTGWIEAIPAPDCSFDLIWCRDILPHLPDLPRAFAECGRVLKPGGKMLIYATFATSLLGPAEAAQLYPPLVVVAQNMEPTYVESIWLAAGFQTILHDPIGSEWREYWEESGSHNTSKQLLKIARMRRDRKRLVQELGEKPYATELANCYWGVYQMLGKLCPTLYVIEHW